MCEDMDHHEPCAPKSDGLAEKISVNGWCIEVVRRYVGIDEITSRRKLSTSKETKKIDSNYDGEVVVDEDGDVVC
jgi:hypothetical protein